jgi:hypothetical protein
VNDKKIVLIAFVNSGKHWLTAILKHLNLPFYKTQQGSTHGRSHTAQQIIQFLENNNKLQNYNIIFLHRDPRDVVVSSYFQVTHRWKKLGYKGTFSEFIRDEREGLEKNIIFNLYWKESNKYNKILVSYEDLHTSPTKTIKNICQFLDYEFNDNSITEAINENTFDKMRSREIANMDNIDVNSLKTRVGKIGNYINYMNSEDIKYCNELLEKYNYFERMK